MYLGAFYVYCYINISAIKWGKSAIFMAGGERYLIMKSCLIIRKQRHSMFAQRIQKRRAGNRLGAASVSVKYILRHLE